MRRVLLALGLALAGVVLFQLPAHACSCAGAQTLTAQVHRATDVFVATVQASAPASGATSYDVRVERIWKGQAQAGATLRTGANQAACGVDLTADRRYLVLGTREGSAVEVNSCSGTRPARAAVVAHVTALLGPGRVPSASTTPSASPAPDPTYQTVGDEAQPGFARLAAPGAAIALVGLLGLLLVRRVGHHH